MERRPMDTTTRTQVLLAGQHAAPPGPVDLMNMYVMHHAFRRDLTAFRLAVGRAAIEDRGQWRALRERWRIFATALHHHHRAEDAGLWPLLLERVGRTGDDAARTVLEAMQDEHARIDPLLDECAGGFARLAEEADQGVRTALRRSLDDAWALLDRHLGHEERDAMTLLQRHLGEVDWLRVEREHFRPAYSLREILSVVPWAMQGLPSDVRRKALAAGGPPFSLLYQLTRRSFARRDAKVFGEAALTVGAGVVDTSSPVLVVGATGTMGGLVLTELVARHADVRVLVRTRRPDDFFPHGTVQVVADLHDAHAVRAALSGARAALYISPHEEDEEELARTFVAAAEATGTRIVFAGVHVSSRGLLGHLQHRATQLMLPAYRPKLRIGSSIASGATNPVIFSPTNFYQNDEIFVPDILAGRYPIPMRRVNRVDVRDLAELCAQALLQPSYPSGEHTIAGPESLSGPECAEIWSEALARPVTYVGDDDSVWEPVFHRRLAGKKLEDMLSSFRFLQRRSVVLAAAVAATTRLLGRPPRGYRDYVLDRAADLSQATEARTLG
ncbi:MAG: NmrA family NAD(P)-binding protein [Kineosporiaceae bacterium]